MKAANLSTAERVVGTVLEAAIFKLTFTTEQALFLLLGMGRLGLTPGFAWRSNGSAGIGWFFVSEER
jgi:hypothetical protein